MTDIVACYVCNLLCDIALSVRIMVDLRGLREPAENLGGMFAEQWWALSSAGVSLTHTAWHGLIVHTIGPVLRQQARTIFYPLASSVQ